MAGFQTKTFMKHDDYMTPKYAWSNIKQFIPDDKIIWDPFYGNGDSGDFLQEIKPESTILHNQDDFFEVCSNLYIGLPTGRIIHEVINEENTCIVTNPPFSKSKEVLTTMKKIGLPFIMILPSSKICTQYFRKLFSGLEDQIQIIVPRKRIHFKKLIWDEETQTMKEPENWKNSCNFDCFYYCWKMDLPKDIIWLEQEVY